ncbi:cystathionine gamma-synthase family protein [Hyphobacterium sp. CCMP332]|nr:cystathionine gamma-synthase family protein [Hyphobacterium sp. CCMP332]
MKKVDNMHPESLMMSFGYDPKLSEGAVKCPIFLTSTFAFNSAEEGKAFFEISYGLREQMPNEKLGLIYSRLNNPDLEILENRLCLWDKAESCAVFESGMSAITTVMLEFLKPGDLLLHSNPVYGGTDHFINHFLPEYKINVMGFRHGDERSNLEDMLNKSGNSGNLAMVYIETPANPTNEIIDIQACVELAQKYSTEDKKVLVVVDNTYMGPIWQHPLDLGADAIVYSATKYIGGHSDLIAGAVLGNADIISRVKTLRTFLGNMAGPYTGWLLLRSLETLKIRMDKQCENAQKVAHFLKEHKKVNAVHYLGLIDKNHRDYELSRKQCSAPGAMISFEVYGGEKEAFQLLNKLKMIKLAVSLGGTESLAEHPATMTHAGIEKEHQLEIGIKPNLIRISIGIEHHEDIINDLAQALEI